MVKKHKFITPCDAKLGESQTESVNRMNALSMAVDCEFISSNAKNNKEKYDAYVRYFSKRPGIWDDGAGNAKEMARRMTIVSILINGIHKVSEMLGLDEGEIKIIAEWGSEGEEEKLGVGMTSDLREQKTALIKKLFTSFVDLGEMGYSERDSEEADLDEEMTSELGRLEWDKKSRGEA